MAETIELKALARESVGKGAARATRREGRVPAVIYGDKKKPEPISLDYVDVLKAVNNTQFLSTIFVIDVEGADKTRVIPRDIQFDVVKDFPMHVDFQRMAKDARLVVEVPVRFINEENCVGLKRGGALNIVRHEIEISCQSDNIPEYLEADIEDVDIGASLHVSKIVLPQGAELTTTDRDFTIASITGHVSDDSETDEGEGAAEAGGEEEPEA